MPPTLAETQAYLWRLITAPEGVDAGLAAMRDEDPRLAARLGEIVVGDERLPAARRLDVYANMYFYRLLDSVREDYPAVSAVIGDDEFHNLITDYLLEHPSTHWSLRYAGQHVPRFLRAHRPGRPWLAPLAELEWTILDAFDAADAPPIDGGDLEALSPEDWAEIRFSATPSVRLLELDWQVDDVWDRAQRGEPAGEAVASPQALLVWRQNLRVYHRPVGDLERDCLRLLLASAPFGAWCEHAADLIGEEEAAEAVVAVLQRWLGDGVLAGFER